MFWQFITLKQSLSSEPVVAYSRKNWSHSLIVDACTGNETSPGGLGAIRCQTDETGEQLAISCAPFHGPQLLRLSVIESKILNEVKKRTKMADTKSTPC